VTVISGMPAALAEVALQCPAFCLRLVAYGQA